MVHRFWATAGKHCNFTAEECRDFHAFVPPIRNEKMALEKSLEREMEKLAGLLGRIVAEDSGSVNDMVVDEDEGLGSGVEGWEMVATEQLIGVGGVVGLLTFRLGSSGWEQKTLRFDDLRKILVNESVFFFDDLVFAFDVFLYLNTVGRRSVYINQLPIRIVVLAGRCQNTT